MGCCKCLEYGWPDKQTPVWENEHGNGFCVFHAPVENKGIDTDEFNTRVYYLIDNFKSIIPADSSCILTGTIFPGEISFKKYNGKNPLPPISFFKSTFTANTIFDGVEFQNVAGFAGTCFEGEASFLSARFTTDTSFTTAAFSGVANFQQARFGGMALFRGTDFKETANFRSASFTGHTTFECAIFSKEAHFIISEFRSDTTFKKVSFNHEAIFQDSIFLGKTNFVETTFLGEASFWLSKFAAQVNFKKSIFHDVNNFTGSNFKDGAFFSDALFKGHTDFNDSTISGTAYFNNTIFLSNVYFGNVVFENISSFFRVKFGFEAYFGNAKFLGKTQFISSKFNENAVFWKAHFVGDTIFEGSTFNGATVFSESKMTGSITFDYVKFTSQTSFSEASFDGVVKFTQCVFYAPMLFRNLHSVIDLRFIDINMSFVDLLFSTLSNMHFQNVSWPMAEKGVRYLIPAEDKPTRVGWEEDSPLLDDNTRLKAVADFYRQMKRRCRDEQNDPEASLWHYAEKEAQLKLLRVEEPWSFRFVMLGIYRVISRYGEDPWQALTFLGYLLAALFFALILGSIPLLGPLPADITWGKVDKFFHCYFQYILFIPKPDWSPPVGIFDAIALLISRLLIPIQAAIFAFALRNKLHR